MLRALIRFLAFGHRPRFADWPEPPAETPPLDLSRLALGPLVFGAPLDEARSFGRPDRHERITPTCSRLLYAPLGLELEFDDHAGLDNISFLIAPDACDPAHPRLRHCSPRLSSGQLLSATTTEADLIQLFGPPTEVDRHDDETCLYHTLHGLRIESELTLADRLKRLSLHPKIA